MERCECEFNYKCIKCGKTKEESIKEIKGVNYPENMTVQDVIYILNLRFKSGNSVPVTRSRIDANEWELIKNYIEMLKKCYNELHKIQFGI